MWLLHFNIFMLLVIASCLSSTSAGTCEETETSHVKLDLAKQSISDAKSLFPKCEDETNNKTNCSLKDRSLAHLNAALDLISDAKLLCQSCPESKDIEHHERPMDCSDVRTKGLKKSGVYQVWPRVRGVNSNKSIDVYCDMETDGGGWTVIQRRGDFGNRTDFYQDWETYKNGFGDMEKEFWLGNEKIYSLTNQGAYAARFDLVDVERVYRYAAYNSFSIGDEKSGYVLNIQNHTGNATDDMRYSHGCMFSTKDKQNDKRAIDEACAEFYESAFWFSNKCSYANLNGVYKPGVIVVTSIWWYNWKKSHECLYSVEFKIRRKNA